VAIINKSGMESLIAQLRKENPGIPEDINSTNTRLVDVEEIGAGIYKATLMGIYTHGWQGRVTFSYRRLDLGLLINPPPPIGVLAVTTVHGALKDIAITTGITLSENDVLDEVLSGQLPLTITLRARPNAALYYGSVELTLVERQKYLNEAITEGDYDHSLTDVDFSSTPVELLSYSNDYTPIASLINFKPEPYATNDTVAIDDRLTRLVNGLNGVDGFNWTVDTGALALGGALVVYAGAVSDMPTEIDSGRGVYTDVLVLELVTGRRVYFYYNWWIDPAIAAQFPGPWEL